MKQGPMPLWGSRFRRWIGERMQALGRQRWLLVALGLVALLGLVVYLVAFFPQRASNPRVTTSVFQAALMEHLQAPQPLDGQPPITWNQPAGMAVLHGTRFVLDTGNDRILELDDAGAVRAIIDRTIDERVALQGPMAIASDGEYLYVANSGAHQILVLTPAGQVVKAIDLANPEAPDGVPPRPIGLAVAANGDILVSDAASHRVLRYDPDGRLLQAIGAGKRESGTKGFNTPGGIAIDAAGNIYVVDILNGRVVQLSPDGAFLGQFGELGDTAGTFSRPKEVAIDATGKVYVSDGLLAAVQVFGPQGEYLGFIGREEPGDSDSGSLFRAPAGLKVAGDTLYVVDRFLGLFAFQVLP
ncbi:MAG: hypothetical protein Q8P22_01740 [Chloroflexota bacterium]|nr:hypothetical protein [Chloroflexota bacterium]